MPPVPTPNLVMATLLWLLLGGFFSALLWAVNGWKSKTPPFAGPAPRPYAPWGTWSVLFVILSFVVTSYVIVGVYSVATRPPAAPAIEKGNQRVARPSLELKYSEQMRLMALVNLVMLVQVPLLLRLTSKTRLADLGLSLHHFRKNLGYGVAGFFLVLPLLYGILGLSILIWRKNEHPLQKMVQNEEGEGMVQLAMLSAVVMAPLVEELLFRGVLQRWLVRLHSMQRLPAETLASNSESRKCEAPAKPVLTSKPNSAGASHSSSEIDSEVIEPAQPLAVTSEIDPGSPGDVPSVEPDFVVEPITELPAKSSNASDPALDPRFAGPPRIGIPIIVTSLLFAAAHAQQWPAPIAIFVLSLALGYLAEATGSLVPSIVLHALFNGFGTLMLFLSMQVAAQPGHKKDAPPPPPLPLPTQNATQQALPRSLQAVAPPLLPLRSNRCF